MGAADPDFRQIFAEDAAGRLEKMSELLLELEKNPGQRASLADLFRDAHSLKGGAGMLGLTRVASTAHAMEDVLQDLRSGRMAVTPALTDALLGAVDGLRSLVRLSTSESDDAAEAALGDAVVARLRQAAASESEGARTELPSPPAASADEGAAPGRPEGPPATMQVTLQRLDQLDRLVGESAAAHLRVGRLLADELRADPETIVEYRDLARLLTQLQELTLRTRMVPLATIGPNLHRTARDLARRSGKRVRWEMTTDDTEIDRKVLDLLRDPLVQLVRNAVDHGLETPDERVAAGKPAQGTVRLRGMQRGSQIVVSVADDGRGIDTQRVRRSAGEAGIDTSAMSELEAMNLIFRSGLSTTGQVTEVSGRGVGLDVVKANLEAIHGRVEVNSEPGRGCEFTIVVPITLTVMKCLVVESAGQRLALPMHSVISLLSPDVTEEHAGGRRLVRHEETALPLFSLAATLEMGIEDAGPIVLVSDGGRALGFRVDRLAGQRELVVKGLGTLLPVLDCVAGAGIEPDGTVVVVLDVPGLAAHARQTEARPAQAGAASRPPSVLVVDDALIVRELQRSILERAGYRVRLAADGKEALGLLRQEPTDLVLTDLEMPVMDGFALTQAIRESPSLSRIAVVILTSHDSESERERGLAAGADAYVIKSGFDEQSLLSLVQQLLLGGRP